MNITQFKKAFKYIIRTDLTPILVGKHGTGKTQVVRQLANENNADMVELRLGQMEVGDLIGLADFTTDKNGNKIATKFIKPDYLPTSGKGIFFLDEINRATKDLHQATFQLVLDKRLHNYHMPKAVFDADGNWVDGWVVVAAMNPNTEDYVVTDISDSAYTDRFCFVKFEPSIDEWLDYGRSKGFSSSVLSLVSKEPRLLDSAKEEFVLDFVKPSRRSMEELSKVDLMRPEKEVLQNIAIGVIGTEATILFMKEREELLDRINAEEMLQKLDVKKLKKFVKEERNDLIKLLTDGIVDLVKTRQAKDETKYPLSFEEDKNLATILLTIPKDASFALTMQLMGVLSSQTRLFSSNPEHFDKDKSINELMSDFSHIRVVAHGKEKS